MSRLLHLVSTTLVAIPMLLSAQGTSPSACSQSAATWFNTTYSQARTAAAKPGGTPVAIAALIKQRDQRLKECAAQFDPAKMTGPELLDLAALESAAGNDRLAKAAVTRRLAEPGLTEDARAKALAQMIRAYTKPDTLIVAKAEPYMALLDAMSNTVMAEKLAAHAALNGEYRYLDVDPMIRRHSEAIIDLARPLKLVDQARGQPQPAGTAPAFTVLIAYTNLAEVYGDFGHADSARAVLAQAMRDHPETPAADAQNVLVPERERYELVGRAAPTITAQHWLNAPGAQRTFSPDGKVTVIEFTAHWCIPCRNSYPAMVAMQHAFADRGVQFVFATQFYGFLGDKQGLDPAAEYAADHEYYIGEHGIHFPVAIADAPAPTKPGEPYHPNPNDAAYHVGGIPQTVIIDRHGVIRRILAGWDTGNAERMPTVIEGLLKGGVSPTP